MGECRYGKVSSEIVEAKSDLNSLHARHGMIGLPSRTSSFVMWRWHLDNLRDARQLGMKRLLVSLPDERILRTNSPACA
eukprot:4129573-Pleurochrysis_carterae.AAC.1